MPITDPVKSRLHPVPSRVLSRGFSLVEVLVAGGVFAIIASAVINLFAVSQESAWVGRNKARSAFLLSEYVEAMKNIRRDDWEALVNGRYIVAQSGGNLVLTPTVDGEAVGNYTRYLDIADAYRDVNGTLTDSSGGTADPSTKQLTVTVSWAGFKDGSISQSSYVTRYLDNLAWIQTTEADFDAGTHTATRVENDAGGEVVLAAGGGGNWCSPNLSIGGLDLPKSGVANAVTAIEGRAFAGTGENASGESFVNIDISNADPPAATILGTFDGYKTNDVFGEEGYGYLATDTNSKEVVIIDLSTTPYTEVGSFDAPGPEDALSVFVYGTTGYVTTLDGKLYNFDLTSKSGSRPAIDADGVELRDEGYAVVVNGNYAYLAIDEDERQLEIVDLTNPADMQVVGYANLGTDDGRDVYVNSSGTRAYVVTERGSEVHDEFFIVDITTKTGQQPVIDSYDAGGMNPKAVEVVPGGYAIIVGHNGEEYQVIDIGDENNILRCGGMEVDPDINDSASILESDGDAYTYIITEDENEEFRIIEGGPGGAYAGSGIFESETLDAGHATAFNRFDATKVEVPQTSIRYQVAGVDPSGADCTTASFSDFDFVGPDGSSGTFFTDDDGIPVDDDGTGFENPAQCFRYRVYLSTNDSNATPVFHDMTVNYSP